MHAHYDRRAPEYDEWYAGEGRWAAHERPGWHEELAALIDALRALPSARTLDVACGTGFLSRHLPGTVCGLDQSAGMLAIAAERLDATVQGDALGRLPFPDGAFDRVSTGNFYGHLRPAERVAFVAEARRVAPELLVIDLARRPDAPADGGHEAFTPEALCAELGGGRVVHAGRWFVAVLTL